MKKPKCTHKKLCLKVTDAFAMHETTEVVCFYCGEPLKKTKSKSEDLSHKQLCYKSGDPCKYDCSGLCKESY